MGVDHAIRVAIDYVRGHFQGSGHRLEEVVHQDDDSFDITVSFLPTDAPAAPPAPFDPARPSRRVLGIDANRQYKVVSVSNEGKVRGVTIRPIMVG